MAHSSAIAMERFFPNREYEMIEMKNAGVVIGAMNLLALSAPMLATQSLSVGHLEKNETIEQINVASIKSIESTWLKVPVSCKARGFHASPVSLDVKEIASSTLNIYSFYQA